MNRGDGTADKSEDDISDAWIKELESGKCGRRPVRGG